MIESRLFMCITKIRFYNVNRELSSMPGNGDSGRTISEISNFYDKKSIFVTGATGQLGQCLVEKLLRSCVNLDKIYLLMRSKKNKTPEQRVQELTNNKLFDLVRAQDKKFQEKLVIIEGDMLFPGLGINETNRKMLQNKTNIVFHSAATVNFNEPLKVAVDMNLKGVKKVIDLCKEMKNLKTLIHVSSAFSNSEFTNIDEKAYDIVPPIKPEKLIELSDSKSVDQLEVLSKNLIGRKTNTYTYTKSNAEHLILEEMKNSNIPSAIVRPSIITSNWREPIPGWANSLNGIGGICAGTSSGLLTVMLVDPKNVPDIVPVDTVVNCMISCAWYTQSELNKSNEIKIYNCTSGYKKGLTWGLFAKATNDIFRQNPVKNAVFKTNFIMTSNKFLQYALLFFANFTSNWIGYDKYC